MNLNDVRQALATALEVVPELLPHPAKPDVINEGSAWPVLFRGRPISFGVDEVEWDLIVALPNLNDEGALDMLERIKEPVATAVASAGWAVTQWAPDRLALGGPGSDSIRILRFRVLTHAN